VYLGVPYAINKVGLLLKKNKNNNTSFTSLGFGKNHQIIGKKKMRNGGTLPSNFNAVKIA
jgi:hypothetical protein